MPEDKPTTNEDIIEAIGEFSNRVEERFDKVEERFDKVEGRLTRVESSMVTKDYLDEKLADMRGDLVIMMRKEDKKVKALTDLLCTKNIITREEQKRLFGMEPFAQLV